MLLKVVYIIFTLDAKKTFNKMLTKKLDWEKKLNLFQNKLLICKKKFLK